MAAPIRVTFVGDSAQLQAATARSEAALAKFAQSAQDAADKASRAAADQAKAAGKSADEQVAAGARAAAAVTDAAERTSAAQNAAARAAVALAKAQGASADEQVAAARRAIAAQGEVEAATKRMAEAQEAAAAKADLLTSHLSGLGEKASSIAGELTKLGTIGFAASIAGMGDLAAKFQEATQSIAANSGISSAAAAKIGTAFLGTSGTTIYSAKELAETFATVAGQLKATEGQALSTGQAMKFMAAASNLGEATGETLASATSALGTIMQGYKLSVNQAASASDLLFNVSRALDQPMNTVAQSMTKLHGRLGDLAPSMGDIGGLMVELGSHGVQGSRGVSVVSTAFQTLIGQSQPVQQMLDTLGVHLFNAQGKFVGMQSAIEQLQPKFAQLNQQSQDLAAKTLFGSSAAQVMLATVERGPAAFAAYTAAAEKHGTAVKGATDQDKTFAKQFDILKATVDNTATSIGLKLMPALTTMAHDLADGVDWLTKNKGAAEALGIAIGAVLGPAVVIFTGQKLYGLTQGLRSTVSGVTTLGGKLLGLSGPSAAAGADIEGVGSAATTAASTVGTAGDEMVTTTGATATGIAAANSEAGASFGAVATEATTAGAALDSGWGAAAARVEVVDDALIAKNEETAASFTTVLGVAARLAGVAGAAAVLIGGDSDMKTYPKHPPGAPQIDAPHKGESRLDYIKGSLGLPPNYKGGPITAASYKGPGEDTKDIDSFFKWLGGAGTFGQKGFQPTAPKMNVALPGVAGSATTANPAQLVNYLQKSLGLTKNQAAGIAGNVQVESAGTFAGNIVQGGARSSTLSGSTAAGGKGGYGLAQWTDAGRQANLEALAKQMGLSQDSVKVQEAFIVQELKGSYSNALKDLRGTSTAAQAATVIQNQYEGPASLTASLAERQNDAIALAGGKTVVPSGGSTAGATGSKSLSASVLNIGSGGTLPAVLQASSATSQATQLSDQANRAQAVGQAQVTELQAINQQLQDKGAATVQNLANLQTKATDHSAAQVTAMKDGQRIVADAAANQVTAMKNVQAVDNQLSAILVAKVTAATTAINDASAINVATINAAATKVSDADNAAATLTTDNAQTNADRISERGLYGLNLVTQQLTVQADIIKAGFDKQIATAQNQLDIDQGAANIANAQAQQATDQVTAAQTLLELQAQQNVNMVTLKQDALEARAQQHLDAVTMSQDAKEAKAQYHMDSVTLKQDARADAAKAHVDAVTVSQDQRILKATQHADNVQLSVDVTKIGPAQTWADMQAGASKTAQTQAQNALNLATAQGSVTTGAANAALANITTGANTTIAQAQNQYQSVQNAANTAIQNATDQYQQSQNAANMAIQKATGQYQSAQNTANSAIQNATDNYQAVQDQANQAIADAGQTAAQTAANWAKQLAADQAALSGIQGSAATGEAAAGAAVTNEQALASTQFAGSGLVVNLYGIDMNNAGMISNETSWAIRSSGLATV